MTVLYLMLLIGACVCFAIAAFLRTQPKVNLVALGLLLFALVPLIQMLIRAD